MALSFPLSTTAFFDLLKVRAVSPYLEFQQELSRQGSGGVIAKDLAPALWKADVSTVPLNDDDFNDIEAMIESLQGSINTFYLYDTKRRYPKSDPTGSIVGSNTVQINSVGGDNKSLTLKGLPASYTISRGDRFSFDYGGTPSRAYHRALETVVANGSGVTPSFMVSPYLRPGAAADQVVTLKIPTALMQIVPGSHRASPELPFSSISFTCSQIIV